MKKLLIVVDMQNDFIDGSLGSDMAQAIVPNVAEKIRAWQQAGQEVIFTLDTHGDDYLQTQEGQRLPVVHCVRDTHGWQLCDALRGFDGKRFEKPVFGSVECARYVADGGYDAVELVGLCTDICVISNAMLLKAFAPQLPVAVDAACCAGVTKESHENALAAMRMCHIDIL